MQRAKYNKIKNLYNGFKGNYTYATVFEKLPEDLKSRLTAKQLAAILNLINSSYHDGRASTGAEMIDGNCVYINALGRSIEWTETGATYEQKEEMMPLSDSFFENMKVKRVYREKTKNGILTAKFCE